MKLWPTRRAGRRAPRSPWGRFRAGLGILLLVLVAGTIGYMTLGLDLLDAVYQTVITVTTVGYREVGDVGDSYQVFSIFLILFGAGASLYTLGVLIETMNAQEVSRFEGRLDDQFRRRRMQRRIDRLRDHVVLCGYGEVGAEIAQELMRAGQSVVIIDEAVPDPEHADGRDWKLVLGDATDDETLMKAGLDRAETLVLALGADVDNLFVALTARAINPDLFIVARVHESTAGPKLRQAGADRVVSPHRIGGTRMAALVSHPEVVGFLDVVMPHGDLVVGLAEIDIAPESVLTGCSLAESRIRQLTGATVLAVLRGGSLETNPSGQFVMLAHDLLIALGTEDQLAALRARATQG